MEIERVIKVVKAVKNLKKTYWNFRKYCNYQTKFKKKKMKAQYRTGTISKLILIKTIHIQISK